VETVFCNVDITCEPLVDCVFSDWGGWSGCSLTCNGVMKRSRRIAAYGSGAGTFCNGPLKEVSACNPVPNVAPPAECSDDPPVDCLLSDWGSWGACSVSCDGGEMSRERSVIHHAQNGGLPCSGDIHQVTDCGRMKCPGPPPIDCAFGLWDDWGACTQCAGERKRFREIAIHPAHGGKNCELTAGEEVGSCPRQCREKLYCTWGEWEEWGGCSAKCGEGKRKRERKLVSTSVPSAPPAPVGELMGMYADIPLYKQQFRAEGLQPLQKQEIFMAFMAGFFSLVAGMLGWRAFAASAGRRTATGDRSLVSLEEAQESCPVEQPMLGRGPAEHPMLGGA
jgi:hypothetical protein